MEEILNNKLSHCLLKLLNREPFFTHLAGHLNRWFTDTVPTMGVGILHGKLTLAVNPAFFQEKLRDDPLRIAVLKHELLHVLFQHPFRQCSTENHTLWNIAADLVVNQYLGEWPLPEGGVSLSMFKEFKLSPGQTLEWYFDWLCQNQKEITHLLPREYFLNESHTLWDSDCSGEQMEALKADMKQIIDHAVSKTLQHQHGSLPGEIQEMLETWNLKTSKIDWHRTLAMFTGSSRKTSVKTTSRRASKRYGTHPGIRIKRHQHLAVALDTSGSVSSKDISTLFSVIRQIWQQGAQITVIECDAVVRKIYEFHGKNPEELLGRGGTDFDPVFRYLRDHPRLQFDGCIYLTDGEADAPTISPPCPLLWVITHGGQTGSHLKFGRSIQLPVDFD
ncbi:MAG: hypothetical protein HQM12_03060 [SAR324 cluster bacterium]|nr:hypothetical protein [SAR324 cluster bacterium]